MPTTPSPVNTIDLHYNYTIDEEARRTKNKDKVNDAKALRNSAHNTTDLYRTLLGGTDKTLHNCGFPNEVVSSIISHHSQRKGTLFQCTLVSQQFNAVATPMLWHTLALDSEAISACFLACLSAMPHHRLSSIGQHTRRLDLHGRYWTDESFQQLIPCLPLLDHLTIDNNVGITDTGFRHVIQHCTQLTSLKLACADLTDVSFAALGGSCHRLVDMEWLAAQHQTSAWLGMFPQLQRLRIDSHHVPLNDNDMTMIQSFRHLTCLEIVDSFTTHMNTLLTIPATTTATNTNSPLQPHWPQLTKLILGPCKDIAAATLVAFFKAHPHLQSLDLMNAPQMTDATLDAISDLTSLELTSCPRVTASGLRRFIRTCRSLEHITLFCCDGVDAYGLWEARLECMTVILDQKAIKQIKRSEQRRYPQRR